MERELTPEEAAFKKEQNDKQNRALINKESWLFALWKQYKIPPIHRVRILSELMQEAREKHKPKKQDPQPA